MIARILFLEQIIQKIHFVYLNQYFCHFLLMILQKNNMHIYQHDRPLESYLQNFDSLITALPQLQRNAIITLDLPKFCKLFESYSYLQARDALTNLLLKGRLSVPKKNWKVEETNYLLFIVDKYCLTYNRLTYHLDLLDWAQISKYVPNRDGPTCQFRYLSHTSLNITLKPWCPVESQLLFQIVQSIPSPNWKIISQRLYSLSPEKIYRTGKQCREHYTCFLRPNLKKGQWTDQEDYLMICLFLKYGKKWSKMTKFIEGRNQNSIKNRFFLLFQNKSQVKLGSSDLMKLAKRKKEKLQKLIVTPINSLQLESQQMNSQPSETISLESEERSSQEINQQEREEGIELQVVMEEPGARMSEQVGVGKAQSSEWTQDIQKYIDL